DTRPPPDRDAALDEPPLQLRLRAGPRRRARGGGGAEARPVAPTRALARGGDLRRGPRLPRESPAPPGPHAAVRDARPRRRVAEGDHRVAASRSLSRELSQPRLLRLLPRGTGPGRDHRGDRRAAP